MTITKATEAAAFASLEALHAAADPETLGFADVVAISGIDARQLRSALDRGTLRIGRKLRVGRWAFSIRDCFQVIVIAALTRSTWTPPSVAAEIAARLAPLFGTFTDDLKAFQEARAKKIELPVPTIEIFAREDTFTIVLWRPDKDGGAFYALDGQKTAAPDFNAAHIRVFPVSLLNRLFNGLTMILAEAED